MNVELESIWKETTMAHGSNMRYVCLKEQRKTTNNFRANNGYRNKDVNLGPRE
jgi:hypothetical protein